MSLWDSWNSVSDANVLGGNTQVKIPITFNCVPGLALSQAQMQAVVAQADSVETVLNVSESSWDYLNLLHPVSFSWVATVNPVDGVTASALRTDIINGLNQANQDAFTSCGSFVVGGLAVLSASPLAPFQNPIGALSFVSIAVVAIVALILFREVKGSL